MTIIPAFFDECLVRAVELRLRHLSPADLASAIDQAESSGYVWFALFMRVFPDSRNRNPPWDTICRI